MTDKKDRKLTPPTQRIPLTSIQEEIMEERRRFTNGYPAEISPLVGGTPLYIPTETDNTGVFFFGVIVGTAFAGISLLIIMGG